VREYLKESVAKGFGERLEESEEPGLPLSPGFPEVPEELEESASPWHPLQHGRSIVARMTRNTGSSLIRPLALADSFISETFATIEI
jgi:hypothetical protein